MPSFPRYLFTVLPKMLVFLGILDMVDGTFDSRNACFPMEFDVWAVFGEFSFLKSAYFPRHSWHGGWNVPSFSRYLFTVLPKMLVFPGIFGHCEWNLASLAWPLCSS